MTLLEPDVTLTDYALTLECALLTWLLYRNGGAPSPQRRWCAAFFAALGVAALFGGSAHGLFADKQTFAYLLVWDASLLAIGVAALAGWSIGARLLFDERGAAWIVRAAMLVFAVYAAVIVFVSHQFVVAIAHYLPAAVFLLVAFVFAYVRQRHPRLLLGALGMALTFVAAGMQQAGIGLHPRYFNHNALYHLVQAAALILIFLAMRSITTRRNDADAA